MPARHPPYPYVEPDAASPTPLEIEILADSCAHDWGCRRDLSLDEICTQAGVDIEYSHYPNEIMLEVPLKAHPVIWLPRPSRKRDDRVIVATALGHWALHMDKSRKAHPGCGIQALYKPTSDQARKEARAFGAAFLMPKDVFVTFWSEGRSQAVSDHFDVPTDFVYLRAASLELHDTV